MNFCPNCAADLSKKPEAKFCWNCAKSLEIVEEPKVVSVKYSVLSLVFAVLALSFAFYTIIPGVSIIFFPQVMVARHYARKYYNRYVANAGKSNVIAKIAKILRIFSIIAIPFFIFSFISIALILGIVLN